jgi:DNA adenine methylase
MPVTYSPLRYPGGKTQLAPFVLDVIQANSLYQGVYCEPFAGGAGVAWQLLLDGHVSEAWINDLDPAIHAFWSAVLFNTDELCELVESTSVTVEEWHLQRSTLQTDGATTIQRGFATLFMNRTNRSGILKGGVIGGLAQTGNYTLDCRYNRTALVRKIKRIGSYREVIRLSRLDAAECLKEWDKILPKRALINIDPPYFAQGKGLYMNYYKAADHADLAEVVRGLHHPWMMTYDNVKEISCLYRGLPQHTSSLIYYAQTKRRANELMVLSPLLTLPIETESFAQRILRIDA